MNSKGVSFIICTFNGQRTIQPAIESVLNQTTTYPFELIVVDNNSDEVNKMYYRQLQKVYSFILVEEPEQGLIYARRKGISVANFDYVAFIDDDNYIRGNWTDIIIDLFEKYPDIGVIGSFSEPFFETKAPDWFETYKNAYAVGQQWHEEGYIDPDVRDYVWGAGLVSKRVIWEKFFKDSKEWRNIVGRKSESLSSGEDGYFCNFVLHHLKLKLYYCPRLHFIHYIPDKRLKTTYLFQLVYGFGKYYAHVSSDRKKWDVLKNGIKLLLLKLRLLLPYSTLKDKVNYYYLKGYLKI